MPFYEYKCESCEETFVDLRAMEDRDSAAPCPACGSKETSRQVSGFATGSGAAAGAPSCASSCESGFS